MKSFQDKEDKNFWKIFSHSAYCEEALETMGCRCGVDKFLAYLHARDARLIAEIGEMVEKMERPLTDKPKKDGKTYATFDYCVGYSPALSDLITHLKGEMR